MSDRDALLAAILAHPDEDTPRLAYADYLDEHGDAPRAEFIRAQIELAQHHGAEPHLLDELGMAGPDGVPWMAHWRLSRTEGHLELRNRADGLLRAHLAEWTTGLPAYTTNANTRDGVTFRRGFVHRVRASLGPLMKSPAALWKHHPVESLWLERLDGAARPKVAACQHLAALRELTLGDPQYDAGRIEPFADCPHFANLRSLDLGYAGTVQNDAAAALARARMRPAALRLACHELDPAAFDELLNSPFAARLRRFSPCRIGSWGLAAVAAAPLAELRFLDASGSACGPAGVGALARSKHQLVALSLRANNLTDAAFETLAAWPGLASVRALTLSGNRAGERGVPALARSPHFRPHYLSLVGTLTGDDGARALAAWPGLADVIDLRLSRTKVTDAGALALAESPHWRDVCHLNLRGNDISKPVAAQLRARFDGRKLDIET